MTNNWKIFDYWSDFRPSIAIEKESHEWNLFNNLVNKFRNISEKKYEDLLKALKQWDDLLAEYGHDPTRYNWTNFRPLRLSREEDWSDWLAHLIHSSKTGCFSALLFGDILKSELTFSNPIFVKREDIQQGYRADIIIQWSNKSFTHIEVKTGDMNLAKTHETGKMLQEKYNVDQGNWSDFILLQP